MEELTRLKTEAKQWFRHEVHKFVVGKIQEQNVTFLKLVNNEVQKLPVRTIEDLLEKVEQDSSDHFLKTLYHVLYKPFDSYCAWSQQMEETFMQEFNLKYTENKKSKHCNQNVLKE